jgi:hypothetical protein
MDHPDWLKIALGGGCYRTVPVYYRSELVLDTIHVWYEQCTMSDCGTELSNFRGPS